jgi:hypothetical protein
VSKLGKAGLGTAGQGTAGHGWAGHGMAGHGGAGQGLYVFFVSSVVLARLDIHSREFKMANGHGGKRPGAGRPKGAVDPRRADIEAFARSVVEHPDVQDRMRTQAREGTMPVPLYQMFYAYAYGRPVEQSRDNALFMHDLLTVVLKYAATEEAQREIEAVIQSHAAGGHRLRVVA